MKNEKKHKLGVGAEYAKALGQQGACKCLKNGQDCTGGESEGSLVRNGTREQRGSRAHGT